METSISQRILLREGFGISRYLDVLSKNVGTRPRPASITSSGAMTWEWLAQGDGNLQTEEAKQMVFEPPRMWEVAGYMLEDELASIRSWWQLEQLGYPQVWSAFRIHDDDDLKRMDDEFEYLKTGRVPVAPGDLETQEEFSEAEGDPPGSPGSNAEEDAPHESDGEQDEGEGAGDGSEDDVDDVGEAGSDGNEGGSEAGGDDDWEKDDEDGSYFRTTFKKKMLTLRT